MVVVCSGGRVSLVLIPLPTHTPTHSYLHTHLHTFTYLHKHLYICTYLHTYLHTHTPPHTHTHEIEPKALFIPGEFSTSELYPQPFFREGFYSFKITIFFVGASNHAVLNVRKSKDNLGAVIYTSEPTSGVRLGGKLLCMLSHLLALSPL